jgi:hypothetical protein
MKRFYKLILWLNTRQNRVKEYNSWLKEWSKNEDQSPEWLHDFTYFYYFPKIAIKTLKQNGLDIDIVVDKHSPPTLIECLNGKF